jgi:hypothetical protein
MRGRPEGKQKTGRSGARMTNPEYLEWCEGATPQKAPRFHRRTVKLPHHSQIRNQSLPSLVCSCRLSRLSFFFHSDSDRSVRRQTNLPAFDLSDETEINEMVMAFVRSFTAIGFSQPDLAVLDPVDCPDMYAVSSNHFHMLFDTIFAHFDSLSAKRRFPCKQALILVASQRSRVRNVHCRVEGVEQSTQRFRLQAPFGNY